MSVSIGDKALKECYVGSNKVKEIYVGSEKVWSSSFWSGTVTTHYPSTEIGTIPDISANTEITITLEYVSGTWGSSGAAGEQRMIVLTSSSSGLQILKPPLSSSNKTYSYSFKKSYNQSFNPLWIRKDEVRGSDTCSLDINWTTGLVRIGRTSTTEYSTESDPVKVTINYQN